MSIILIMIPAMFLAVLEDVLHKASDFIENNGNRIRNKLVEIYGLIVGCIMVWTGNVEC